MMKMINKLCLIAILLILTGCVEETTVYRTVHTHQHVYNSADHSCVQTCMRNRNHYLNSCTIHYTECLEIRNSYGHYICHNQQTDCRANGESRYDSCYRTCRNNNQTIISTTPVTQLNNVQNNSIQQNSNVYQSNVYNNNVTHHSQQDNTSSGYSAYSSTQRTQSNSQSYPQSYSESYTKSYAQTKEEKPNARQRLAEKLARRRAQEAEKSRNNNFIIENTTTAPPVQKPLMNEADAEILNQNPGASEGSRNRLEEKLARRRAQEAEKSRNNNFIIENPTTTTTAPPVQKPVMNEADAEILNQNPGASEDARQKLAEKLKRRRAQEAGNDVNSN